MSFDYTNITYDDFEIKLCDFFNTRIKKENDNYLFYDEFNISRHYFQTLFESLKPYDFDNYVLSYSGLDYEVAVNTDIRLMDRNLADLNKIYDADNNIEYAISGMSNEYSLAILINVLFNEKFYYDKRMILGRISILSKIGNDFDNPDNDDKSVFAKIFNFRALTVKIKFETTTQISLFKDIFNSFVFNFMYNTNLSIIEYSDKNDMFSLKRKITNRKFNEINLIPKKLYNYELTNYYKLAIESSDDFVTFISYYHIMEYFYNDIFKKEIIKKLKNYLTQPEFTYKNDDKVYEIVPLVTKNLSNNSHIIEGNEKDSLERVIASYAPIEEITNKLNLIDTSLYTYFKDIPIFENSKTKINWNNGDSAYSNLANRIYSVRNALIHSKRNEKSTIIKPYQYADLLLKETFLLKVIAELIILNSSSDL